MTSPLHFPWCDPPSCDVDAEGYSAHRSRMVELKTYSHGPVSARLYQVAFPDLVSTGLTLLIGEPEPALSLPWTEFAKAITELESLQQPRVVAS